jgi:hypothetical protein
MRLDPVFSQQYLHFLGLAYLVVGKYETAAALFTERVLLVPQTDFMRAFLAAAFGHLGKSTRLDGYGASSRRSIQNIHSANTSASWRLGTKRMSTGSGRVWRRRGCRIEAVARIERKMSAYGDERT